MEILWQIIGFVGMATIILSFQIKNPKLLVMTQAFAQTMFVIHYVMIGSPAGAIQNFLAIVRALLILSGNKYLSSKVAKYIMMALFLVSPAFVYNNIFDFLPGIAMMINTYYIWSMNSKMVRLSQAAIVSPLWITYNAINLSLPGIFTEVFNLTSSVIFLIRTRKMKESSKQAK